MMAESKPTTPNSVWIATAILHRENPKRDAFQSKEIFDKVKELNLQGASDATLSIHISSHCVASGKASPDTHRKLTRVATAWFRLYKSGDDFHPTRSNGKIEPLPEMIPEQYRYLIDWYKEVYCAVITTSKEITEKAEISKIENDGSIRLSQLILDFLEVQGGDFVATIPGKEGEILIKKAKIKFEI